MPASLKTTNYNLPLYAENDITSWLTDFNGAMTKIDTQLKATNDSIADLDVSQIQGDVESLQSTVQTIQETIQTIQSSVSTLTAKMDTLKNVVTTSSDGTGVTATQYDKLKVVAN